MTPTSLLLVMLQTHIIYSCLSVTLYSPMVSLMQAHRKSARLSLSNKSCMVSSGID